MWWNNIINVAGSTATNLPALGTFSTSMLTSATSNSGTVNNISVGVRDMWINLFKIHMPDAVSVVKEIYIKQFSSTFHTITSGNAEEFNVSFNKNKRITHIGCAFVQQRGLKCSPTDFSAGFYASNTINTGAYTVATEVMKWLILLQILITLLLVYI